jgi:hypothetical protein
LKDLYQYNECDNPERLSGTKAQRFISMKSLERFICNHLFCSHSRALDAKFFARSRGLNYRLSGKSVTGRLQTGEGILAACTYEYQPHSCHGKKFIRVNFGNTIRRSGQMQANPAHFLSHQFIQEGCQRNDSSSSIVDSPPMDLEQRRGRMYIVVDPRCCQDCTNSQPP